MKINSTLPEIAVSEYYKILTATPSRSDALKSIADRAIADFGEYITPGNLNINDEVMISLIELIDQIVYEFHENTDYNSNIRDYIIDDIYSRISLTLEALNSSETYLSNIWNRPLYPDDLVIIKNKKLSVMIPHLISESAGITNLQKNIIKTLLHFEDPSLLEFFYNSFKETSSGFIRSAAVLGLKYNEKKGLNWNSLADISSENSAFILYAEKFDISRLDHNPQPSVKEELTFALLHTERDITFMNDISSIKWIITMLISVPSFSFENSWLYEINTSICNILLNINLDILREILKDESMLVSTMRFIDLLPGSIFNRLTGRFDSLGMEFLFNLNSAVERKKVAVSCSNSNILNYLCWNAAETF